jgi:uncharacterized membrane-anchored protein
MTVVGADEGITMQKLAALVVVMWASGVGVAAGQDPPPAGWMPGPVVGKLGDRASISLPEGYFFLDRNATRRFLEQNQNIPDGDELGIVLRVMPDDEYWFAVFSYSDTGHIDNSERDSLDADGLLKSMKDGNLRSNEERKKRGWTPLVLLDWQQRPFYDQATDNLTWATLLTSDDELIVNHSVRLLGRTGLMSAQLVADPGTIDTATSEFNDVLKTYSFSRGQRYAEFRSGDKLAGYGLAALIAGGAGAAAVKTGVLQKLWKVLVLGVVALVGGIKKVLSALGRRSGSAEPAAASGSQGT